MKKIVKMLLLAAVFTLALSVSAFAASGTDAGICDVQTYESGVTVAPKLADGTAASQNSGGVYKDAVRMTVTFSGATANKYYLVVALDGEGYPTADNVAYINQMTAASGSVSFDVYPKELKHGQTYSVYVSSNDGTNGYEKVASYSYYAPYKLGDVDENDKIQAVDALRVLRHVAKQITLNETQQLAADVNADNKIQAVDALRILRYVAKQITEF